MTLLAAMGAALRRIPGWVYVLLFALAGLWLFGRYQKEQGREEVRAEWAASVEKGKAEIERLKSEAGKVTVRVETKVVEKIRTIREKGETIVQKVPVYVPAGLPDLPAGWRLLHDHAAAGTVPGPSEAANGAPVAPETAAATVAANYTQCLATAEQLRGLQEWVTEQKRLNP
jgi:hypothetical protein